MFTNVIVTFAKSYILITTEELGLLTNIAPDAWFESSAGDKIRGSSISEIITLETYYNRFPDKKPESPLPEFNSYEDLVHKTVEEYIADSKTRTKGLLLGLKKYCDEHPDEKKARALYKEKLDACKLRFGVI